MIRYENLEAWKAEGKKRFGDNVDDWRFVCPACGHIASVADYKQADMPAGTIGFSCIGRADMDTAADAFTGGGGPCNYAGGGLFKINPVVIGDESEYTLFDFAPPPNEE